MAALDDILDQSESDDDLNDLLNSSATFKDYHNSVQGQLAAYDAAINSVIHGSQPTTSTQPQAGAGVLHFLPPGFRAVTGRTMPGQEEGVHFLPPGFSTTTGDDGTLKFLPPGFSAIRTPAPGAAGATSAQPPLPPVATPPGYDLNVNTGEFVQQSREGTINGKPVSEVLDQGFSRLGTPTPGESFASGVDINKNTGEFVPHDRVGTINGKPASEVLVNPVYASPAAPRQDMRFQNITPPTQPFESPISLSLQPRQDRLSVQNSIFPQLPY